MRQWSTSFCVVSTLCVLGEITSTRITGSTTSTTFGSRRLAAMDQGVGLVDRVRINPHRHAVGVGPAGQPGSANRLPQGDLRHYQLALVVAGPLGRHRDHLAGDQLVAAPLPGWAIAPGTKSSAVVITGWNGHRGLLFQPFVAGVHSAPRCP